MGSGAQVKRLALNKTMGNYSIVTESKKGGQGRSLKDLNREKTAYRHIFFNIVTIKNKTTFLFIPLHKRNYL